MADEMAIRRDLAGYGKLVELARRLGVEPIDRPVGYGRMGIMADTGEVFDVFELVSAAIDKIEGATHDG